MEIGGCQVDEMLIQWDTVDNKNQPVKEFQIETQVWLEEMIIAILPSWSFSSDDDRTDFTAHSGLDTGLSYATLDIAHSGEKMAFSWFWLHV